MMVLRLGYSEFLLSMPHPFKRDTSSNYSRLEVADDNTYPRLGATGTE
jgi:hypothetical protein